jgi:Domain of unknown function (DUF6431)
VAMVWACRLSVEAYAAAGKAVVVPRPRCPACRAWMVSWSGYWRSVRVGRTWRIWVRRARCSSCRVSHGLLPSFCLVGRRFGVEVIGPAVEAHVQGRGTRSIARAAGVEQWTARSWCGRHRERARLALAVGLSLARSLGVRVDVAASVEAAALSALEVGVSVACETEGLARWSALSLVTKGMWLGPVGPTRSRVFSGAAAGRLMVLSDRSNGERPP